MTRAFNTDCLEAMSNMKDNQFDLAICDPPYGIGNFSQSDAIHKDVDWNNSIPDLTYFTELKRVSKKRIIWGANYYNCFEEGNGGLVWYKNMGHKSMSQCEIASISGQQKIDYYHQNWSGGVRPKGNIHPCAKPIQLYKWLLKNYAKEGDTIIDTHAGSMSSVIACLDMGFDMTAFEIDEDYFNQARKRVETHLLQLNLFQEKPEIVFKNEYR